MHSRNFSHPKFAHSPTKLVHSIFKIRGSTPLVSRSACGREIAAPVNLDQFIESGAALGSHLVGSKMIQRDGFSDANGTAALGICESLLVALTDLEIISEKDARDLLTDVATTHEEAASLCQTPGTHRAVVTIVHRILAGGPASWKHR